MMDKIIKRNGKIVPFDREKITFAVFRAAVAVGGRDRAEAEAVTAQVLSLLGRRIPPGSYPTVEEVQDAVEKVLIERGHARTAKAYILYRYEHTLKRAGRESLTYSSENIPYRKLWEALTWAVDHSCVYTADLVRYVEQGRFPDLIRESEACYRNEVADTADRIIDRLDEIRVIVIAGPSSSGKTTTTIKISEHLAGRGKRFVPINADNYFFDLVSHPKDPSGDYDYETPQSIDLELFNSHLSLLLSGEEIGVPFYNFKKGIRDGIAGTVRLGENDILLIDSLHGLFDGMTASVPPESIFKVYIETLAQTKDSGGSFLRWADIRMLRRMIRDLQFRNYDPRQTLHHWHHVRRSELRYIVSRLRHAHAVVNSYLPSELPVLGHRLRGYFPEFIRELEGVEEKADAYERAVRVRNLFEEIPDWKDESLIPEDSLLREFIGGSSYAY